MLVELHGGFGALRFVVEDQSCKEETFGEKVNSKGMKTSISIRGNKTCWHLKAYNIHKKKTINKPWDALK